MTVTEACDTAAKPIVPPMLYVPVDDPHISDE
jgi:hypothetical protein